MKSKTTDKSSVAGVDRSQFVGADLAGTDLSGVALESANLEGADLSYANLKGANLKDANLRFSNLKGAILKGANLEGANLEGAYLKGANLVNVNLKGANICCVSLKAKAEKEKNLEVDKTKVVKVAVPLSQATAQTSVFEEGDLEVAATANEDNVTEQEDGTRILELDYMELRALKIAVEDKIISASSIQKKLKMGFQQAVLILDKFEELNFIDPVGANKQHNVLLSNEDYEQRFGRN